VNGPNIIPWEKGDGQPFVHQAKSRVLNIIAPRCKLAMDNLTRNQTPKLMTIKTAASFFRGKLAGVCQNQGGDSNSSM
jgi:hypothetical protein